MLKKMAAAAVFAALSATAFAADGIGPYVGGDLGKTKVDGFGSNLTSYGVFGGYNFNSNVAAEVGYRHLGKVTFLGTDVNLSQTAISVIGSFPVGNEFSLFGRLGYNQLSGSVAGHDVSASSNGALIGIGASYKVTPQVSVRAEVQRPASDAKNLSFGVVYAF